MTSYPVHVVFPGRLVFLGFGSIGQGVLPLILRHVGIQPDQVTIVTADEAGRVDADLLALDSRVTDCNSAFFDVAHGFAGCIAGCHEVLRRQGLMAGTWCLDPAEALSPGQAAEIDRVCREHADLSDDAFVAANLQRWLA